MDLFVKTEIIALIKQLKKEGFEAYLVGGCVRDLLLGTQVKDWDIATNATPEKILDIFPNALYNNSYGTVSVPYGSGEEFAEITTYRTEQGYTDFRHPGNVSWGESLAEDVKRRDFTVNAIALEIFNTADTKVIDLVGGVKDLERKLIRAVGNPDERFKEDALRLLRTVRLSNQLGFTIEDNTLSAIKNDSSLIEHVSGERIRDELFKILATANPYDGIEILDKTGLLDIIFPELAKGKGVSQARPGRHHTETVFTHNVLSLKYCPSDDPLVRLATLLHDVGKPEVSSVDEDGYVIFYNHEVVGARIAKDIADRLRLSKKQKDRLYTLIRWHMFTVNENITDSAVRRFIRRVGVENVKDIIDLRIGDRLGGGTQTAESWRLKNFKERLNTQLNPPFSITDLAVDGNDIMKELNIPPGRKVGELLQKLFEEVDEDLSKNKRDLLISRLHEIKTTE